MPSYKITTFAKQGGEKKEYTIYEDPKVLIDWLREWSAGDKVTINIEKIPDNISGSKIISVLREWKDRLDRGMPVSDVLMAMDRELTKWMQETNSRWKRNCIDEQVIDCTKDDSIANAVRTTFRRLYHRRKRTPGS